MRTKLLLVGAAALAMGVAASANAQVYSANVVGYVTVSLNSGNNMVANQMDIDGNGTNNSIYTCVGTNLPSGTLVEAWNGASFGQSKLSGTGKWSVNNASISNAMTIGHGFFINVAAPTNFIEVGNVIQGTNTYTIIAGNQPVSFGVPLSGTIDASFGYHPSKGDIQEIWNGASFGNHKWSGTAWGAGDPTLAISQAEFLNAVSNNVWTQGFKVQ